MYSEQQNPNPVEDQPETADFDETTENQKRNSGKTGPTSTTGRATSARNATRHGMCATTLIMPHENEDDWFQLLNTWLDGYNNPAENSLLYTFVLKTAQAEWYRLRNQEEHNRYCTGHAKAPAITWTPDEVKSHDLVMRYLTAAERRFQREYRMLEHHWKSHHKPTPEKKKAQPDPEPVDDEMPDIRFVNNETGESVDSYGNHYPPPPDYKPEPIIPGVYGPNHLSNYRPHKKPDSNR